MLTRYFMCRLCCITCLDNLDGVGVTRVLNHWGMRRVTGTGRALLARAAMTSLVLICDLLRHC